MHKTYLCIVIATILMTGCGSSGNKSDLDTTDNNTTQKDGNTDQKSADTTKPVIDIKGNNPKYIAIGRDYNDDGATAKDNIDGTVEVSVAGEVDTLTTGTYKITYTAEDKAGNKATAVRKVIVQDITHNGISYGVIVSPVTGKIWLDKNLGAAEICEDANEDTSPACAGDLYQWGRNADGHEDSISATRSTKISGLESSDGKFVIGQADWSNSTHRGANWSKLDGSSVCPAGFRVPTIDELKAEYGNNKDYLRIKNLKLPVYMPLRSGHDGHLVEANDKANVRGGGLWSTTVSGITEDNFGSYEPLSKLKAPGAHALFYALSNGPDGDDITTLRSNGLSVRCIKP